MGREALLGFGLAMSVATGLITFLGVMTGGKVPWVTYSIAFSFGGIYSFLEARRMKKKVQ